MGEFIQQKLGKGMIRKPLPIGVDDFKKLRINGYYYVDKTRFIKDLLDKKGEVNLFTRPRRFGKTLNLSMLRYFFERGGSERGNAELFCGLAIEQAGSRYMEQMGRYPVIMLSLKSAKQPDFRLALCMLEEEILREYQRYSFIADSGLLGAKAERFQRILRQEAEYEDFITSIRFLSECLELYYQEKVIILIDEYDVPLENAFFEGFYKEMIDFIRSLLESALKTNPSLEFAVLTGCLRISRESVFTGLNNLKIISILSDNYGEYFGFEPEEVNRILFDFDREDLFDTIKEWYDGYLFGNKEVYNPWSMLNYVEALTANPSAFPIPYWSNTSSNSIVRDLIKRADSTVKKEIEDLIAGGRIEKKVHEDITYGDVYDSEENLWNFLFFTGYLRQESKRMEEESVLLTMTIPNLEIRYIYKNAIRNWFRDEIRKKDLNRMYQALLSGDAGPFQNELQRLLGQTISYMDSQEAFYHSFLLGVLANMSDYVVESNRESGRGRTDIVVKSQDLAQAPVILELKVAEKFKDLDSKCEEAIRQIEKMEYDSWAPEEGYTEVIYYGIAFFRKQCRIKTKRRGFPEEQA